MKSSAIYPVDKKVNKSLQDRLRRDRISRSVEQLRELILGPSIEHVKIGKADILKLTVQYIRNLRQKELMETTSEDHKSMETDNTELEPMKTVGDNFVDKPSTTCSNQGRLQTTEKSGSGTEAGSENSKKFSDENVKSNQKLLNRTQSQNCPAQSAVFQNAPGLSISRNGAQTRAPFRQLNCNSKQTIWRPW